MNNTNETFVADVIEFNRDLLGIPERQPGLMPTPEFSHLVKCLREELDELIDGHTLHNPVSSVDALIDLQYFLIGGLYKMGLTREMIIDCQRAVHSANMTKVKAKVTKRYVEGAVDAGKPADFVAPEAAIARILGL